MELAKHYSRHCKVLSAETLAESTLKRCREKLDPQDPKGIEVQHSVASIKKAMTKYDDARVTLTALLEQMEQGKCLDMELLYSVRCDLGAVMVDEKEFAEAETLLEKTLAEFKRDCSDNRPLITYILEMLASAKSWLGKHQDAEMYQREALARNK
jgi:uncharacterized protein HemY